MHFLFGPFQFDARNLSLSGSEGEIVLRAMTMRLLHELLKDAPNVIGQEQLLDRVWGRQAVTPGVLSQSILELRRALGDSAQNPCYIETRHRLGYRFVADVVQHDVDECPSVTSNGAQADVDPGSPEASTSQLRRRSLIAWGAAIGVLAITVALVAWWTLDRGDIERHASLRSVELLHDGRPNEPEALGWYRDGLRALEQADEISALELLKKSLNREPSAVATQAALAEALAKSGDRNQALQLARSAVKGSSALPRVEQLRIAAFEAELDYRLPDAIAKWQAVSELDPGDVGSALRLATVQISAGETKAADATLAVIDQLPAALVDPSRLALLRARLATSRGDQRERLAQAELASRDAKNEAQRIAAWIEQAWAHALIGEREAAEALMTRLDEVLSATPEIPLAMRRDLLRATLQREAAAFDQAIAIFDSVATRATAHGERAIAANARREAGFVLALAGRHKEALERLVPLVDEHDALGDPRELASTLDVVGLAQQRAGAMKEAQAYGERSLALYVAAGDHLGEAAARNQLGMAFARTGRFDDAQHHWEKALAAFEDIGDRRGTAIARGNLATIFAREGNAQAAREANESALVDFRAVGAIADVTRIQFNLALQDRRGGDLVAAEARMREALDGFTQMGNEDFRLQAMASLAELLLSRADLDSAQALLDAAQPAQAAPPQRLAAILTARARLDALRGQYESAQTGFNEAKRLRKAAGLTDWVRMSDLDLAELAARQGRLGEAHDEARRLRRELLAVGDISAANQAGTLLASVLLARRAHDAAGRLLDELDAALAQHPEAQLALRADLVRAGIAGGDRDAALGRVATRARA
ncbi:MAG: tetratricopeptide repeat protein, partial [Dokdonella sp.]